MAFHDDIQSVRLFDCGFNPVAEKSETATRNQLAMQQNTVSIAKKMMKSIYFRNFSDSLSIVAKRTSVLRQNKGHCLLGCGSGPVEEVSLFRKCSSLEVQRKAKTISDTASAAASSLGNPIAPIPPVPFPLA
jgi:hypothetical protein